MPYSVIIKLHPGNECLTVLQHNAQSLQQCTQHRYCAGQKIIDCSAEILLCEVHVDKTMRKSTDHMTMQLQVTGGNAKMD